MTSAGTRPPASRIWPLVAWALCVGGAAIRIAGYARNPAMRHDEAALALNIIHRGFAGLLAPLDYLQTAPPLFLWLERLSVLSFGSSERALRLVPLLCGIATAPMMWRVGRRMLPASAATLAVGLVALSPVLIFFAGDAKPYAGDALITLLIVDGALTAADPSAGARRWWALAVTGLLAVLMSTPAILVLGGATVCLLATGFAARSRSAIGRALLLGAAWAATFAALTMSVFRPVVGDATPIGRFMHTGWSQSFLTPDQPQFVTRLLLLAWTALPGTFLGKGDVPNATSLFAMLIAVGGAALIIDRQLPRVLLLVVPFVLLMLASALRLYPVAQRLMLFATPLSALLVASSQLIVERRGWSRAGAWLTPVVTAGILVLAARGAAAELRPRILGRESRVLVRQAAAELAEGTPVWVSAGGEVAWRYYDASSAGPPRDDSPPVDVTRRRLGGDVLFGSPLYSVATRTGRDVSEWSESEASRIRALARPCALLFLAHTRPNESDTLLAHARALGATLRDSRRSPGSELHRVCFPAVGGAPSRAQAQH